MKAILFSVIIILPFFGLILSALSLLMREAIETKKKTYRTNNALSVSMHEIYDGNRTFFVSSPQIKKQRPKKKSFFFRINLLMK
jgi:hypothetical protein